MLHGKRISMGKKNKRHLLYIHNTRTHITNEQEIFMTISLHFYDWSCNHSCIYHYFLLTYSVFPLLWSLPAGMTQTFILKESRPLIVLPGLAYNFLLILITGPGNAKRSPVFQTSFSLPPFWSSKPISPWQSGSVTSASLLCLLSQKNEECKVAGKES